MLDLVDMILDTEHLGDWCGDGDTAALVDAAPGQTAYFDRSIVALADDLHAWENNPKHYRIEED